MISLAPWTRRRPLRLAACAPESWVDGCSGADLQRGLPVAAVNLATRHLPAAVAADRVATWSLSVSSAIGSTTVVYKKVDSTLRGQVVAEVQAMAGALGRRRILFVPAVLGQGRTMRAGQVLVDGVPLGETDYSGDPRSPAPTLSIPELFAQAPSAGHSLPVSTASTPPSGPGIWAPDVTCPADIEVAARWALADPEATICVGAAGLSQAIGAVRFAGTIAEPLWRRASSALFVVGSRSVVSRRQIEQLCQQLEVPVFALPGGVLSDALRDEAVAALSPGRATSCAAAVIHTVGAGQLAENVARSLGHSVHQLFSRCAPEVIVLTGGDTALAVLNALSLPTLDVIGQWRVGVPASVIKVNGAAITCVTKAGGFGEADLFVELLRGLFGCVASGR